METKILLKKIKQWYAKGHKPIELAYKLGYETPATIDAWFRKKEIPNQMKTSILSIINK